MTRTRRTRRSNKNAKILLSSLNQEPRTKEPNVPCDGNEKYRTPPPYRSVIGTSPSNIALRNWLTTTLQLRYFGTSPSILLFSDQVPWDIPSLCCSPLSPFSPSPLFCPDWADTLTVSGGFVDTLSVSGVWTPGGRMCDSSFNQSAFVALMFVTGTCNLYIRPTSKMYIFVFRSH